MPKTCAHLRRHLALPILLAAFGCSQQDTIAPSEPATTTLEPQELRGKLPFILRGAIVAPNGVLKHGYIGIAGGSITSLRQAAGHPRCRRHQHRRNYPAGLRRRSQSCALERAAALASR